MPVGCKRLDSKTGYILNRAFRVYIQSNLANATVT